MRSNSSLTGGQGGACLFCFVGVRFHSGKIMRDSCGKQAHSCLYSFHLEKRKRQDKTILEEHKRAEVDANIKIVDRFSLSYFTDIPCERRNSRLDSYSS